MINEERNYYLNLLMKNQTQLTLSGHLHVKVKPTQIHLHGDQFKISYYCLFLASNCITF